MNLLDEAREETKADLTPMIDCVFLMIVFFVCIDFRVLEAKLPAYLPKDRGIGPAQIAPQEMLSLKIFCEQDGSRQPRVPGAVGGAAGRPAPYRLVGHAFRWQLGPERIDTADDLRRRLEAIAADPDSLQPDADDPRRLRLLPVVVEPQAGVVYDDVAQTVDLVKAAKFDTVRFGGGMGAR